MPASFDKSLTGYAQELKNQGKYPLPHRTPWKDRAEHPPVATPFIVIPNFSGDQGIQRPLDAAQSLCSEAIQIIEPTTGLAVSTPVIGQTYKLQCLVQNFGAMGCFAGIAEFYVASPGLLDAFAAGSTKRPAPLGYGGVMIPAGGQATAVCQRQWTVSDLNVAILVCVYDPIIDKAAYPYDSAFDRHVARLNLYPDFTGSYQGKQYFVESPGINGFLNKVVIQQVKNVATISIYSEITLLDPSSLINKPFTKPTNPALGHLSTNISGLIPPLHTVDRGQLRPSRGRSSRQNVEKGLPATPQIHGSATVTGNTFVFDVIEENGGKPFTHNIITFTLTNNNLLHYTWQNHFLFPEDANRADQFMVADLPRQ